MFDTLLIITLLLLASILNCLLTLRLSINIKHLCHIFHSLTILMDILKFQPPPFKLITPHSLNLTKISEPLPSPPPRPPFIRHLE